MLADIVKWGSRDSYYIFLKYSVATDKYLLVANFFHLINYDWALSLLKNYEGYPINFSLIYRMKLQEMIIH
jgi:hypothetical protein